MHLRKMHLRTAKSAGGTHAGADGPDERADAEPDVRLSGAHRSTALDLRGSRVHDGRGGCGGSALSVLRPADGPGCQLRDDEASL